MINAGDLIRYSEFPHKELHKSGMTGLVLSEPYSEDDELQEGGAAYYLVDVMWGSARGKLYPAGCICQEYVDELEAIE